MYDVVVVGCGAAGLAALGRVTRAGLRAAGLEAAARAGGRVRTVRLGGRVELGAEWVHGETDNSVFELARRSSVPLSKDLIEFDVRRSDGTAPDRELCDELLGYCMAVKGEAESGDRPLGEYVTSEFYEYVRSRPGPCDEELCRALLALAHLLRNNYDGTNDWGDTSVRGSAQYEELAGHLHWSFGGAGYGTVVRLLEEAAPMDIKLSSEVREVQCLADRALVTCTDGRVYEARAVIVTVSIGVLKERHKTMFRPPLPAAKVEAIEAMSMGVVGKVCLRYERAWWPRGRKFVGFAWRADDRAKVEEWMTQILGFSSPTGSDTVITLWTSGETAKQVEVMDEARLLAGCKRLLQMFMGSAVAVPDPVEMVRSQWYSDPLTRGSYSYRGRATDSRPRACADLAEPVRAASGRPLLLFAGEACSERHYSTVHGAVDSGTRAAELVLAHARAPLQRSKV